MQFPKFSRLRLRKQQLSEKCSLRIKTAIADTDNEKTESVSYSRTCTAQSVSYSRTCTAHYMPLTLNSVFINQTMKNKSRPENPLTFCAVIVLLQLHGNRALKNAKSDIQS